MSGEPSDDCIPMWGVILAIFVETLAQIEFHLALVYL